MTTPTTDQTLHLDLPAGRLAYDDTGGDGPLVLCVPGLGDLRAEYRHLRPLLVAAGHRVVTMDLRGHGESSTGWPSHTPDDVGRDIVALLDHLDVGPQGAVVMGCSLGAAAAVWAAAERPGTVRGLVLAGPFVRDLPSPWWQRLLLRVMTAGLWTAYLKSLFPSGSPHDRAAHLAAVRSNLRQPGRMTAVREMLLAPKAACEARIPEVGAQALVLMGSADPDFPDPVAEAAHVASALGGEAVVLDGLGHYPHAEDARQTAAHVIGLVERSCPAPA